jgi:2-iminobutanoate/2-iminopropanoate deaminase
MNKTFGPYSPIRIIGNIAFISGQIGVDPETEVAAEDITSQTNQVMKNMKAILQSEHLNLESVVKTTVFLTDMNNFQAMNAAYEQWFEGPRPARSAVAVKELPRVAGDTKLLVEIEAIAVVSE